MASPRVVMGVASIELICENCGTANPQGAQFCQNCKSFLAWDRTTPSTPTQPRPATGPVPPVAGTPIGPPPTAPGARPPLPPTQVTTAVQPTPQRDTAWAGFCTWCGAGNPAGRHLCRRCGLLLDRNDAWAVPRVAGGQAPIAAAAEHQRSVPGWYRLRGVIGAAAVLAVVAGAAGLVLANPVGRATDTWATLNRQAVDVPVAGVSVEPPGAVAGNNTPGAAIDGKVEELSLAWTPSGEAACGAAPGTGWIVLQLREPTRIQGLMIYPGLHGDNPRRDAEYLPTLVGVEFDGVACAARQLGTAADWATIEVDSGRPVSTIRIGIARAETKSTEPGPRVSITEIRPFTYA